MRRRLIIMIMLLVAISVLGVIGWLLIRGTAYSPSRDLLREFFSEPGKRAALITHMTAPCPNAPFLLPSTGFVGFLYNDPTAPYTPLNPHTGIDIFGDNKPGTIPVYAAYDGYLTRLPGWKSALIIRIPKDPLNPSRQIWTYYTHMASESGSESYISPDFPTGTSEKFVKQGTLLGYQGLFDPSHVIKMHLHFSVVLSDDSGVFRNETYFSNTIDPSPYFGFTLNAAKNPTLPVRCGL